MKTIDLGKILFDQVDKLREDYPDINLYSDEDMKVSPEYNYFINAMKEACRQTLELAAENAKTEMEYNPENITFHTIVYKQSILNTINQIE